MNGRRFALIAAIALTVMFVSANLIASVWFRAWRLDLTEHHLYSLSPGTGQVLDHLSEPVELKLYYSRDTAAQNPQVQTYGARVREMLQTFAARSHGHVRFVEVNVKPFSEEEDQAVEAGIDPIQLYEGADPLYFGLTGANAIDDRRTIARFDPGREQFLEYEVTRLIYELENPDPTKVALITSLPIDPAHAADSRFGQSGAPMFAIEMGRLLQVTKLADDFTEIPADANVLAIIHPGPLTPAQSYAIDQFILRKGRAFIALDPASMWAQEAAGAGNPFDPMGGGQAQTASTLEPLLGAWGVAMTPEVVMDFQAALPVSAPDPNGQTQTVPQPLFFQVDKDHLDREDLMTAWLARGINFGLAGGLTYSERPGLEAHPLATTTGNTARLPAAAAMMRPSPFELANYPRGAGRIENIALRLTGTLHTAYPNGPPEGAPAAPPQTPRLTQSASPAELVIVSDVDFLNDAFYLNPQTGDAAADNASFALNAIDVLGGSDALVSLRSRAASVRPMKRVEDMERDAQRRIQRRQEELQGELQETESRLQELQARGRGSGFFSGNLGAELTPEEKQEIERFRARVTEVRTELRRTERDLRGDIDQLETLMVFINVWLAPILVAGAGLFLFWRRQRQVRVKDVRTEGAPR